MSKCIFVFYDTCITKNDCYKRHLCSPLPCISCHRMKPHHRTVVYCLLFNVQWAREYWAFILFSSDTRLSHARMSDALSAISCMLWYFWDGRSQPHDKQPRMQRSVPRFQSSNILQHVIVIYCYASTTQLDGVYLSVVPVQAIINHCPYFYAMVLSRGCHLPSNAIWKRMSEHQTSSTLRRTGSPKDKLGNFNNAQASIN